MIMLVETVEPWSTACTSAGALPARRRRSPTPVAKPWEGSWGVVGVLAVQRRPVPRSASATSVKVPPTSTAMTVVVTVEEYTASGRGRAAG
jgi:hypothetical protein